MLSTNFNLVVRGASHEKLKPKVFLVITNLLVAGQLGAEKGQEKWYTVPEKDQVVGTAEILFPLRGSTFPTAGVLRRYPLSFLAFRGQRPAPFLIGLMSNRAASQYALIYKARC